jgi:hypothetical protein
MNDRTRQIIVTLSAVFMIVGTLFGTGVIGTRVEESSGGSLSATATLIAPAVPAFSIWSVIYLGLVAYVVWQWLPANTTSSRLRSTGLLAALSMILNALWLLVTQVHWLWVSVVVILALAVTLGELVRRLGSSAGVSRVERVLVDGTYGLYLGWVSVATAANITATLVDSGVNPSIGIAQWVAVVVVAVAAAIGVALARTLGGRIGVALAMVWGLSWIAVGRLSSEPASSVVGIAAIVAAAVVAGAAVFVRTRSGRSAAVATA